MPQGQTEAKVDTLGFLFFWRFEKIPYFSIHFLNL
jgi:hypothetical protein